MKVSACVMCAFGVLISGCGAQRETPDFAFIDDFLVTWDDFARGRNDLLPKIKASDSRFHSELAAALDSGDTRAPSRLVFYLVVQVGGFIAVESELGQAARRLLGDSFPVFVKTDRVMYYAGDLYYWWENEAQGYDSFPLYVEWKSRDFSQKLIPMYLRQATESRKGALEQRRPS